MNQKFNFTTYHNQFYLVDKEFDGDTGDINFWNEASLESRIALGNGIIGIYSESYGNIKGEIEIIEKAFQVDDFSSFDHIVEGSINIKSGVLTILNCPDNDLELSIDIRPGKYRVRIYSSNLKSVKESDFSNDSDNDYYRIELWIDDEFEVKILKRFLR